MILNFRSLAVLLFITSFFGFSFVAAIAAIGGYDSRPLSIMMRAFVVVLSLMMILRMRKPNLDRWGRAMFVALLVFWGVYLVRLMFYTAFHAEILLYSADHYWVWALGVSFLPMLGLAFAPMPYDIRRFYLVVFGVCSVVAILILVRADTHIWKDNALVTHGRLMLESLNPISLARHGAVLSLLAAWGLLYRKALDLSRSWNAVLVTFGAVGVFMVFASGSRGPLIALMGALLILPLLMYGRRSFKATGIVATLGLVSVFVFRYVESSGRFTIVSRLANAFSGDDMAMAGRFGSFQGAWEVFLENPTVGFGLEEPYSNFYPHNLVLEAMMSTGIVGALPFLVFLGLAIRTIVLFSKKDPFVCLVGILFIFHLIASMFSGSIWGSGFLWTLAGLLVATEAARNSRRSYLQHGREREQQTGGWSSGNGSRLEPR